MNRAEQYGVTIDGKHSYKDYGLISISPIFVMPSEIQTVQTEIPGVDGVIDYTEAITGDPAESSRAGEWNFRYIGKDWEPLQRRLYPLNGKLCSVVLDDDPDVTYTARITIGDFKTDDVKTDITIEYEVI